MQSATVRAAAVVLDVFGGSGTALIAAGAAGRRLIEYDPLYVDDHPALGELHRQTCSTSRPRQQSFRGGGDRRGWAEPKPTRTSGGGGLR